MAFSSVKLCDCDDIFLPSTCHTKLVTWPPLIADLFLEWFLDYCKLANSAFTAALWQSKHILSTSSEWWWSLPNCKGAIGFIRALFITLAAVFLCKSIDTNHLSHCLWVCKWIIQLHVIWWDAIFATAGCCTFESYWHNCRKGLLYLRVKFLRTLISICSFNNLLTSHSQYHDAYLPLSVRYSECNTQLSAGWAGVHHFLTL